MGTASVATEESKPLRSRYQLQSVIQSTLLDGCTLTKPRTVQAVVLAAGLFLVVDELRDRAQQSPGGILGSMHFCTSAMASETASPKAGRAAVSATSEIAKVLLSMVFLPEYADYLDFVPLRRCA